MGLLATWIQRWAMASIYLGTWLLFDRRTDYCNSWTDFFDVSGSVLPGCNTGTFPTNNGSILDTATKSLFQNQATTDSRCTIYDPSTASLDRLFASKRDTQYPICVKAGPEAKSWHFLSLATRKTFIITDYAVIRSLYLTIFLYPGLWLVLLFPAHGSCRRNGGEPGLFPLRSGAPRSGTRGRLSWNGRGMSI